MTDSNGRGQVNRRAVGDMLTNLFDHWKLTAEERLITLGFSPASTKAFDMFRRGEEVPEFEATVERARHLFAIHKNLRTLFSQNRTLAYSWMKTPNKSFESHSPIELIAKRGVDGLLSVLSYLEQAQI